VDIPDHSRRPDCRIPPDSCDIPASAARATGSEKGKHRWQAPDIGPPCNRGSETDPRRAELIKGELASGHRWLFHEFGRVFLANLLAPPNTEDRPRAPGSRRRVRFHLIGPLLTTGAHFLEGPEAGVPAGRPEKAHVEVGRKGPNISPMGDIRFRLAPRCLSGRAAQAGRHPGSAYHVERRRLLSM